MSTAYKRDDIPQMLEEFGVPVKCGDDTTFGVVDRTDDEILAGVAAHALGPRIEVTLLTGSLPDLRDGINVTVDGEDYIANYVRRIDDGALTQFTCTQV